MDVIAVVMLYRTLVRIGDSSMRVHRGSFTPAFFIYFTDKDMAMLTHGEATV
jgi:hypothetical protein